MPERGAETPLPGGDHARSSRLLWIAGAAFAVLFLAWAVLFVLAHRHRVEEVPLTQPAKRG